MPNRCQAKNRAGELCGNPAVPGKRVCRLHGGLTPSGPASPHWKNGRYSRTLIGKLAAQYEACENDRELLSVRSEVAIVGARIQQLAERVSAGVESGAAWQSLRSAWAELQAASASKDADVFQKSLTEVGRLIKEGSGEESQWEELLNLLNRKSHLASREHARQRDLAAFIPVEEVTRLIGALAEAVRASVTEEKAIEKIIRSFEAVLYRGLVPASAITQSRLAAPVNDPGDGSAAQAAATIEGDFAPQPTASTAPPDAAQSIDLPAISIGEKVENISDGDQ